MPRRRAVASSLSAAVAGFGRIGAWLGVLALVVQLLTPLATVRAATWVEEGLFPPACSLFQSDDGSGALPQQGGCCHCPLCQAMSVDRTLALPVTVAVIAYPSYRIVAQPVSRLTLPAGIAAHPPLPSRGPPSAA